VRVAAGLPVLHGQQHRSRYDAVLRFTDTAELAGCDCCGQIALLAPQYP
jgi:hypothetical protein